METIKIEEVKTETVVEVSPTLEIKKKKVRFACIKWGK
jgi:hypothetical protein